MGVDERLNLEEDIALERARGGLLSFATYVMPQFQINWHHKIICRAINYMMEDKTPRQLLASFGIAGQRLKQQLQRPHPITKLYAGMTNVAMLDRPIRSLQIALPPRHTKSWLVSVCLPGYWLGKNPNARIIAATYGASLTQELSSDALRVVTSPEYKRIFPHVALGQNEAGNMRGKLTRTAFDVHNAQGRYRATSVSGALTGLASDLTIVDDPHKDRAEVESATIREQVWRWYTSTLYTRGQKGVKRIIAATRWRHDDLPSRLITTAQADPVADQWFCLILPALLDTEPGPGDERQEGEALWPSHFSAQALEAIRATAGTFEFEALYQQRPSPRGGGVIKQDWLNSYTVLPANLTQYTLSADLSFEDRGDYSVFQVWATQGASRYLVEQVRKKMAFTEQVATMRALTSRYPQATAKLVEKAANGAALIDTLKKTIPGIIAIKPQGSKELRVDAISPILEAGNVYIPSPETAPWVQDFVAELLAFPNGAFDDCVDSMSQALAYLNKRNLDTLAGLGFASGDTNHVVNRLQRHRF